jgi:hypothetical protein
MAARQRSVPTISLRRNLPSYLFLNLQATDGEQEK